MKLILDNIGMLKHAEITLHRLCVIAGENDNGKSTVGKIVFCIVKAINRFREDLQESKEFLVGEKTEEIFFRLRDGLRSTGPEVLDALSWVDDFIARCNGDDRGACESVNVLRRAFASHGQAPAQAASQDFTRTHHRLMGDAMKSRLENGSHEAMMDSYAQAAPAAVARPSEPKCSACGARLQEVTQGPNSYLSADQFDADKLGDWFCECCPEGPNKGSRKHRYFDNYEILEKVDTLIASINEAHLSKSDGWRQGCFAAADSVYEQIKVMLAAAPTTQQAE